MATGTVERNTVDVAAAVKSIGIGVEVDNLVYFASQSWPFPHSLMIAFTAEYAGGDMRPCDAEIADAKWFSLDALPQLPSPVSISRKLIDATVARLART